MNNVKYQYTSVQRPWHIESFDTMYHKAESLKQQSGNPLVIRLKTYGHKGNNFRQRNMQRLLFVLFKNVLYNIDQRYHKCTPIQSKSHQTLAFCCFGVILNLAVKTKILTGVWPSHIVKHRWRVSNLVFFVPRMLIKMLKHVQYL